MSFKRNVLKIALLMIIGLMTGQVFANTDTDQKSSRLSNYEKSLKTEKDTDVRVRENTGYSDTETSDNSVWNHSVDNMDEQEEDLMSELFFSLVQYVLFYNRDIDERLPKTYQTKAVKSYEDFTGPYQINYGTRMNNQSFDNKTGSQGSVSKRFPNLYNHDGTIANSIGVGIDLKKFEEGDGESTWEQVYICFNQARLYQDTSAESGFKLGLGGTTFKNVTNVGFLFGTDYAFYDFLNNYSFHADYSGILYNEASTQFQLSLDSNVTSFIRLYVWKLNLDFGGEFKVTNGDSDTYSQQAFIRAGFRF